MRNYLFMMSLLCLCAGYSQTKVSFEYDQAGNQIKRSACNTCRLATQPLVKDETEIVAADMEISQDSDVISYYPNPVKEQLYLKWEINEGNAITAIQL